MKSFLIVGAGASAALLLAAAPAFADDASYISGYGNLGYTNAQITSDGSPDFSAITGRLGARFGKFLGVEGEVTGGLNSDHIGGTNADVRLNDEYGVYAVGFLPVLPNADLLARIGYANTDFHTSDGAGSFHGSDTSWNYGVGGQYMFDGANGVRLDYTRADYHSIPDANVWSVSYVRKF